jgi:hypothetical protein
VIVSVLDDIRYDADAAPEYSVCLSVFRRFSIVFCSVCLLLVWSHSIVEAQSDTKNRQNRNVRENRNTLSANSAIVMMREKQASYQKIPWDELSPAVQSKIQSVVSGASLFHRMPQQTIYADPEIYHYFIQHPDLVIGFWEQLGATQLSLHEVRENRYILKEESNTTANIQVVYRTKDICIVYAKGEYRGPLLAKSYQGEVILVLRTQLTRDESDEPMVVCDLDAFVQINSLGADMLAKLFFASLTKIAESNFEITASFVSQVSRVASRDTTTLKAVTEDITSVRQDVCADFCDIVDRAAIRNARRNRPLPLAMTQDRTRSLEPAPVEHHEFSISSKPPTDWGMDHFFDTPQPPYASVRSNNIGELDIPRPLVLRSTGNIIPTLPKTQRNIKM